MIYLSMVSSIHLLMYQSIHLPPYEHLALSLHPFIYPPFPNEAHLPTSINRSIYLPIDLSIYLSLSVSIHLSIYVSMYPRIDQCTMCALCFSGRVILFILFIHANLCIDPIMRSWKLETLKIKMDHPGAPG